MYYNGYQKCSTVRTKRTNRVCTTEMQDSASFSPSLTSRRPHVRHREPDPSHSHLEPRPPRLPLGPHRSHVHRPYRLLPHEIQLPHPVNCYCWEKLGLGWRSEVGEGAVDVRGASRLGRARRGAERDERLGRSSGGELVEWKGREWRKTGEDVEVAKCASIFASQRRRIWTEGEGGGVSVCGARFAREGCTSPPPTKLITHLRIA